jgi:hypothetical protein
MIAARWFGVLAVGAALSLSACGHHTFIVGDSLSTAAPVSMSVSGDADLRANCPNGVAKIVASQSALRKLLTLGFSDVINVRVWCAAPQVGLASPATAAPRQIIIVPGS